ncbi:MAG: dihydropteroate synthase, partial [Pseudomonadota bacterium]
MKDASVADYLRPIAMSDPARPVGALPLAGGSCWFDRVEVLSRAALPRIVAAGDLPQADQKRLSAARPDFGGLDMTKPRIMGILNITPDSFS